MASKQVDREVVADAAVGEPDLAQLATQPAVEPGEVAGVQRHRLEQQRERERHAHGDDHRQVGGERHVK
jgi:hypothetical protein